MCDVGGPRCVYASLWQARKRQLQRSQEFKKANVYEQENLLRVARNTFQQDNSEFFQEHLPKKQRWQTQAKPWTRRKCANLAKTFPFPSTFDLNEAVALTENLVQEFKTLLGSLTRDEENSLYSYSFVGYENINSFLRMGRKPNARFTPYETDLIETHIKNLDSVVNKGNNPSGPLRALYRHILVPAGISPQSWADKYFKVGERVTDKGFMSTSEDTAYIRAHIHKRHPSDYVVLQILTRQGISLQRTVEEPGRLQSFEKERLLPRGLPLRVVSVRKTAFTVHPSRVLVRRQFSKDKNLWKAGIQPKTFTLVRLIDESES